MKWLAIILLIPSFCFAEEFHLEYHLLYGKIDNQIKVVVDANSFLEAIDKGASLCFQAFQNLAPITEDFKLDLTDSCANPRLDQHSKN